MRLSEVSFCGSASSVLLLFAFNIYFLVILSSYFMSSFYFMCHVVCLLNLFLKCIKKKNQIVAFSACEVLVDRGLLCGSGVVSLSSKQRKHVILLRRVTWRQAWLLQTRMHGLKWFLLLRPGA